MAYKAISYPLRQLLTAWRQQWTGSLVILVTTDQELQACSGCCGLLLRCTCRIEELISLAVGSAGLWWPQLSPSVGIVLCGRDLPHPRFHSLPGPLLWFWTTLKGHSSSRIPYRISCIWVQQMGFYFCTALLTTAKPLTLWITTNCGKFWKRWEYQTTWPASWEIGMQVKKQQLELDMEQQTSSKSGKKYVKAVYYHPAYLTYMQSTSCKMPG